MYTKENVTMLNEKTMAAYKVAVEQKYRFFSFGDAMFIRSVK